MHNQAYVYSFKIFIINVLGKQSHVQPSLLNLSTSTSYERFEFERKYTSTYVLLLLHVAMQLHNAQKSCIVVELLTYFY
jgi:hypothetical protein